MADEQKTGTFQMRVDPEWLERIDDWRRHQKDLPSRAEAIRRLVGSGLALQAVGRAAGGVSTSTPSPEMILRPTPREMDALLTVSRGARPRVIGTCCNRGWLRRVKGGFELTESGRSYLERRV